ncbi:MAG TPA: antibiotic biosynthesis monooxygenase [Candidatus Acidoferrum sp.]|nr:antibiotic biosynthesis monooxygenase [Candidatus Acidoferrum sp.]
MTVLTIHKRLRPPALTDCNGYNLDFARNGVPTWLVSNWIATLGRTALCLPEFALQSGVRPRAGDGTSMFVALWEFEVKPGCEKRFLKVYGPEGDWTTLFRKDANYQETQLLHDLHRPATYLILDYWASRQAYETFMATHAAEYKRLDAAGERLTLRERKIGLFKLVDS